MLGKGFFVGVGVDGWSRSTDEKILNLFSYIIHYFPFSVTTLTISLGYHVSPALSSVLFSSHENIFTTVSSVTTLSLDSK